MSRGLMGLGYTGLTCATAGGVWDGASGVCNFLSPPTVVPPTLPVGYDPLTGQVDSANTIGQTVASLSTTAADLCAQEGGTWNGTTCDMPSPCSLPLGTYSETTGTCSYVNLYLLVGAAALILMAMLGRK